MRLIYRKINELLIEHGMTKKELAVKAGIPYSTLVSAFNRDTGNLSVRNIAKIASALNVSVNALLGWEYVGTDKDGVEVYSPTDMEAFFNTRPVDEPHNEEEPNSASKVSPKEALNAAFDKLNPVGQDKAVETVEDLTEVPKYKK